MDFLAAIVLGVVEGLTEFLPVSSTGHLILVSELLGIEQTDFHKSFEVAIQLGAIGSVVALFWRSLLDVEVIKRLFVAFVPTAIVGFTLYDLVRHQLLGNPEVVVATLFLGGIALIFFEYWHTENPHAAEHARDMTWKQALLVGLCQSVALVPGVSRSGATIVGGLLVGLKRTTIVEFSFLLAVPTMAAATGLDLVKTEAWSFSGEEWVFLAVGFVTAFLVALGAIRFLLHYVRNHTFVPFGVYRIILAALFFLFVL